MACKSAPPSWTPRLHGPNMSPICPEKLGAVGVDVVGEEADGGDAAATYGTCVPRGREARPVWYAEYRLPDGRQVQRRIGPAWRGRGRPAPGFHTKRTAEAWLGDVLDQARHGVLPGMTRTGATFADAAAEWLRYVEEERGRKPSTITDYRSVVRAHLLPAFGQRRLEDITTEESPASLRSAHAGLGSPTCSTRRGRGRCPG